MGFLDIIGFGDAQAYDSELPDIFPVTIAEDKFVRTDLFTTYAKILTDVSERTHGLKVEEQYLLWDNCLKSEASDGLITLLAKAMSEKADLFLVFDRSIDVVRKATSDEETRIRQDYGKVAKSSAGVFISFKNYQRTEMLRLYSTLEYCTVAGLYKQTNIAKAIQIKFVDMRKSVSAADKGDFIATAKKLATALKGGKDIAFDAGDSVETAKVDLEPTQTAIDFISEKKAFYLGLPASYIKGEKKSAALNESADGEVKLTERGLKNYFHSVFKPVVDELFDADTSYKSQDNQQIALGLEALKTFSITEDDLINTKQKSLILNQLFDFDTLGGSDADGVKSKPKPGDDAAKPGGAKTELPAKTDRP